MNLDFLDRILKPERVLPGAEVEADAVVVGTGAGGAVAACELAEAGLDVAMLEEGEFLTARDYGRLTPLEAVKLLYRHGGLTFTMGNASVLLPAGQCVGGTTVINSGTALRAVPEATDRWVAEFGLRELVRSLDGTYERVEAALGVSPVADEIFGGNGRIFRRGAEHQGFRGAVLTRAERGCRGAGRCYLGCPNDAKQATNVSYVPRALRAGARLFVRAEARCVVIERGRAVGVKAFLRPKAGAAFPALFRANVVVVAAGAVHTPLLLAGVGGCGRGLGRNLKIHPASRVVGLFDEEVRGWDGVPQGYHLEETLREGISIEGVFLPPALLGPSIPQLGESHAEVMRRYNNLAMLGYRVIETGEGRVLPRVLGWPRAWPIIWYRLRRSDVRLLARAGALAAEILFGAGAQRVFTAIRGFEVMDSADDARRLRAAELGASDMELSAYHAQGTARMADRPDLGVANPWGEVWGVRDLYVADASAIPATPVSNPQVSIMAFATHVAAGILARRGRALRERMEETTAHS
ncbi:MAG: GMC family oxidoreductase [Planctomycetes bacterium]|nr:GMC family oxidoreductase [Planctomycetota bacterium]